LVAEQTVSGDQVPGGRRRSADPGVGLGSRIDATAVRRELRLAQARKQQPSGQELAKRALEEGKADETARRSSLGVQETASVAATAKAPPMPFKVFVLSAGVFEMPWRRFVVTLLISRGLRYTFWGVMGVMYGDEALAMLKRFDAWFGGSISTILLVVAIILVALGLWYLWWRRAAAAARSSSHSHRCRERPSSR